MTLTFVYNNMHIVYMLQLLNRIYLSLPVRDNGGGKCIIPQIVQYIDGIINVNGLNGLIPSMQFRYVLIFRPLKINIIFIV